MGAVLLVAVIASSCGLISNETDPDPTPQPPVTAPPVAIPPIALNAYARTGQPCPGVDWAVIAGIGKVESNHGRITGNGADSSGVVTPTILGPPLDGSGAGGNTTPMPSGKWEGQYGSSGPWLRALGPMQFLPETFEKYGADGDGDGQKDPHNIYDATAAAANLLCANQPESATDATEAVLAYNQSESYRDKVFEWADNYRNGGLSLTE